MKHIISYNELEEIASTLIEAGADINAVISEKKSKSKRGQVYKISYYKFDK